MCRLARELVPARRERDEPCRRRKLLANDGLRNGDDPRRAFGTNDTAKVSAVVANHAHQIRASLEELRVRSQCLDRGRVHEVLVRRDFDLGTGVVLSISVVA